jgi:hypothetical protein
VTVRRAVWFACLVAGCSSTQSPTATAPVARAFVPQPTGYEQTPPFSRLGYAPFSRADAVAIALREWRLWGSPVDDDPPGTRPPPGPDEKPERFPGLWQRVGEYWWTAMDSSTRFASWTGKHDETGAEFPASADSHYPWSAAFISYVMRIAGAGEHFPYSAAHADYINAAREVSLGQASGIALSAERPDAYAPQPGDLICLGRGVSRGLTFDDLPTASFPGHCDIVVAATPGELTVIGGNVDDAVTEKHVPTTPNGMLAPPGGPPVDTRYPWFVVLRVLYTQ